MSLSRAFTTRRSANKKPLDITPAMPQRSLTTKHFATGTIQRAKISAPVELISTTNMLSYNAPDLYPKTTGSISESENERSPTSTMSRSSTPPTSPDASSTASSPVTPEPNHLSCYFGAGPTQGNPADEVPAIPQRALSHTKKSTTSLSSKRSISHMTSASKNALHTTRSSINMFSANVESALIVGQVPEHVEKILEHPFGNELAQVTELAEEYGVQEDMKLLDAEEQDLLSKGLFKFRAEDYMNEIHGLFISTFGESTKPTMAPMWI